MGEALRRDASSLFTTTALPPLPMGEEDGSKWTQCPTTPAMQVMLLPMENCMLLAATPNPSVDIDLRCKCIRPDQDGVLHLPWILPRGLERTAVPLLLETIYSSSEAGILPPSTPLHVAKIATRVQN